MKQIWRVCRLSSGSGIVPHYLSVAPKRWAGKKLRNSSSCFFSPSSPSLSPRLPPRKVSQVKTACSCLFAPLSRLVQVSRGSPNTHAPLDKYFNLSGRVNFACPCRFHLRALATFPDNFLIGRFRPLRVSSLCSVCCVTVAGEGRREEHRAYFSSSPCRHNQQNMAVLCRHVVTSMARGGTFGESIFFPSLRPSVTFLGWPEETAVGTPYQRRAPARIQAC